MKKLLVLSCVFALSFTCLYGQKYLKGKVRVVTSFPDYKVRVVTSFPDLKVQKVTSFPNSDGKWQFVDAFEDFTIQFVDSFEDFTIQFVDAFPCLTAYCNPPLSRQLSPQRYFTLCAGTPELYIYACNIVFPLGLPCVAQAHTCACYHSRNKPSREVTLKAIVVP